MGRKSKHEVGFDVPATVRLLHGALLDAHVVERDSDAAKDPLQTAMIHVCAHGMQMSGLCDLRPCQLGGISFALYEIMIYERERTGSPLVPAAEAAEQLASVLRTEFARFGPSMLHLFLRARAQHELEAKHLKALMHPHELVCEGPSWLSSTMIHLIVGLEDFGKAARSRLESTELQQSRSSKRSKLLLNSVYQALRAGGLSYAKIAALVPDGIGEKGAAERVRKRVKAADARSLSPFDHEEGADVSLHHDIST